MASSKALVVVMPKKKPPPVVASIAETISKYSKPIFKKPVTTPKAEELKQRTVPRAAKPEKPDVAPPPKKSRFVGRWQYQFDNDVDNSVFKIMTTTCRNDKDDAMDAARMGLAGSLAKCITPEQRQRLGLTVDTFKGSSPEQIMRKMIDATKNIAWHRQLSSLISTLEIKPDGTTEEHFPAPESVYRSVHHVFIINFGW
jgi:hypothetical protein